MNIAILKNETEIIKNFMEHFEQLVKCIGERGHNVDLSSSIRGLPNQISYYDLAVLNSRGEDLAPLEREILNRNGFRVILYNGRNDRVGFHEFKESSQVYSLPVVLSKEGRERLIYFMENEWK